MPVATRHPVNEDLEKRRLRRRHDRALRPGVLRKAIAECSSAEDEADFARALTDSARRTADAPPYDLRRLRAGERKLACGGLVMGAVQPLIFGLGQGQAGLQTTLMQVMLLAGLVIGAFLLWTGYELRNGDHLPRLLTGDMVTEADRLLHVTREHARHAGSAVGQHLSRAILLADGALLFFLLTPLLLPGSTPTVHLIVAAAGALLVAKVSSEAVGSAARAIRKGQVLANHDALTDAADSESQATADALRQAYGPVVGYRWPRAPGSWRLYGAVVPPVLVLVALTTVLLVARLGLGDGEADLLGMGIVALIVVLSLCGAIALRVDSECLTPAIAQAKRIIDRFPSAAQFLQERRADHEELRTGLLHARRTLRAACRPRWHGAPTREADFAMLDLEASPVDTPIRRVGGRGTLSVPLARSGSIRPAATFAAAAMASGRRTASEFHPNPDWDRR